MSKFITILILFISSNAIADSLLLRVEVNKQEPTDYHPPCEDKGDGTICIPWSLWTIYHSRVIQVIDGKYEEERINIAVLQHANFIPEVVKDTYLIVEEFSNLDTIKKLGTKYHSDGPISTTPMVCLPISYVEKAKDKDKFSTVYWKSTDGKDYCYTKRGLDHSDDEEQVNSQTP
ncbi:MAG: hypothetical protein OQJ89_09530 [Kangiellaceae bacterium]|nr:hypothetical protein [Kangiellaceae bacterium]MCW8997215.1 hypothetical protein [Kangiellaceae bacterium]MCW9017194.1 hypothetical protein [Kangiellaceae bacterium]